jgi:hypothetical protein
LDDAGDDKARQLLIKHQNFKDRVKILDLTNRYLEE